MGTHRGQVAMTSLGGDLLQRLQLEAEVEFSI